MKGLRTQLDDMLDLWLMVEHNDVWKIIDEKKKQNEVVASFDSDILSADDMKGMLEQVKSLVGVVD